MALQTREAPVFSATRTIEPTALPCPARPMANSAIISGRTASARPTR